jgi:transcriptional antiterminator NusG
VSTEPNDHDNLLDASPAIAEPSAVGGDLPPADLPSDGTSVETEAEAPTPDEPDDAPALAESGDTTPEDAGGEGDDPSASSMDAEDEDEDEEEEDDGSFEDVEPIELIEESDDADGSDAEKEWYILKVQVNREESIRDALQRRVKIEGLDGYFGDIVVPTEDIAEFTKTGKRRIVKKKLYPGYIMVNMSINDDTWFVVRETPGIGDFTGSAGRPAPMDPKDVERILKLGEDDDDDEAQVKTSIPFNVGDHVRVKEGNFENFEGDVENIDEAKGRVTVKINIFGRSTPVEFEHWQIEAI